MMAAIRCHLRLSNRSVLRTLETLAIGSLSTHIEGQHDKVMEAPRNKNRREDGHLPNMSVFKISFAQ